VRNRARPTTLPEPGVPNRAGASPLPGPEEKRAPRDARIREIPGGRIWFGNFRSVSRSAEVHVREEALPVALEATLASPVHV